HDKAYLVSVECECVKGMERHYAQLAMPRHYVLGNHCVGTLTKAEFSQHTKGTGGHESFEAAGVTFLVLDACYREDGTPYGRKNFNWQDANLPKAELAWME